MLVFANILHRSWRYLDLAFDLFEFRLAQQYYLDYIEISTRKIIQNIIDEDLCFIC